MDEKEIIYQRVRKSPKRLAREFRAFNERRGKTRKSFERRANGSRSVQRFSRADALFLRLCARLPPHSSPTRLCGLSNLISSYNRVLNHASGVRVKLYEDRLYIEQVLASPACVQHARSAISQDRAPRDSSRVYRPFTSVTIHPKVFGNRHAVNNGDLSLDRDRVTSLTTELFFGL